MTTATTASASATAGSHEELIHLTCCRADDPGRVALCGTDVTNDRWVDPATKTTCVVCADMESPCDGDYDACPFMAPAKGAGR